MRVDDAAFSAILSLAVIADINRYYISHHVYSRSRFGHTLPLFDCTIGVIVVYSP